MPAEALHERLRRARARRHFEDLDVIQPYLEVIGRGLHYYRRLESLVHPTDSFCGKIIDEGQGMLTLGPDVDMSAVYVFMTKPLDRLLDVDGTLPFPQNHFTSVAPDAEFEAFAP